MPYMMGGQMGMGPGSGPSNMRLPGPPRNAGMQQIPPSGPMMRAQVRTLTIYSLYSPADCSKLSPVCSSFIAISILHLHAIMTRLSPCPKLCPSVL